jgi:hypothetical protein
MNAHLSDLSDRIRHLLTRRGDPRVLLGITVITIAALVAGAVTYPALHHLGSGEPRPRDPLPQERAVGGILPSPPS